jgi:hypothetical protein
MTFARALSELEGLGVAQNRRRLLREPRIERETHGSPNRARESMNAALIAIGKRGGRLRREARRIAKVLGAVEIDHGETSCKTRDARVELR